MFMSAILRLPGTFNVLNILSHACIDTHTVISAGGKRKSCNEKQCHEDTECIKKLKLTPTLKPGRITDDKLLMDIAWEIGEKWEEVGIALGINYKVLSSTIGSNATSKSHMKAFYMLQEWKNRAADSSTYITLASALEEVGLNSCAKTHCYINNNENEQ